MEKEQRAHRKYFWVIDGSGENQMWKAKREELGKKITFFFRSKATLTLTSKIESQLRKWAMKHWLLHAIMPLLPSCQAQELFDCVECWLHCKHEHCLHILPEFIIKSRPLIQGVNKHLLVRGNNGSLFHQRASRRANTLTQGRTPLSPACARH